MTIIKSAPQAHTEPKRKVTCLTCHLKKCVGHCKFEAVGSPAPKAA